MNKLFLTLRISIILVSAAGLSSCEELDFNGIEGNGPVVSREIVTEKAEGILLDIPATVYLSQGDVQRMTIVAQENIQNNIECYNINGVMKLEFSQPVLKVKPIVIHLTIQSLKETTITGSGSIISRNSFETAEPLRIKISGSGDIDLNADAPTVNILITGSGSLNLITKTNQINAEINGSGDLNLKGVSVESSGFYIKGSGNINAYPIILKSCFVETYGSGNTRVNVSEMLNINTYGSGDVYYKGDPLISAKINGSGKLIKVN